MVGRQRGKRDTNGADVYYKVLSAGIIHRASRSNGTGVRPNASSSAPSISSDGHTIAFVSSATNLVSGDTNGEMFQRGPLS